MVLMVPAPAHLRRAHREEGEPTDGAGPVRLEPGFEAVAVEEVAANEERVSEGMRRRGGTR